MLVLSYVHFKNPNSYLLVVHCERSAENNVEMYLRKMVRFYRIRSKTVSRGGTEITIEVRLDKTADLVGGILEQDGVLDATMVACQSEVGS